jgi:hypothetical protein
MIWVVETTQEECVGSCTIPVKRAYKLCSRQGLFNSNVKAVEGVCEQFVSEYLNPNTTQIHKYTNLCICVCVFVFVYI